MISLVYRTPIGAIAPGAIAPMIFKPFRAFGRIHHECLRVGRRESYLQRGVIGVTPPCFGALLPYTFRHRSYRWV